MPLDQATRILSIKIAGLGENEVVLTSFAGTEGISRLFEFNLELVSERDDLKPAEVVGQSVSFAIERANGEQRYFHGFISEFHAGDLNDHRHREYSATVVPWLWFLTQTADCKIFQNKKVPQILEEVFKSLGFSDFETSEIKEDHPEWEYCVQYRETDFNFVSRLMEQEGIFYYFRHERNRHVLVLADQKNAYEDCQEKEVDFPEQVDQQPKEGQITAWHRSFRFHTGKWAHTDYDFSKPSTDLTGEAVTTSKLPKVKDYEIFDYPGEFTEVSVSTNVAKIRLGEDETSAETISASSLCKTFTPGGKFKLRSHCIKSEMGTYAITSIEHWAHETLAYETGEGGTQEYRNRFHAIPHDTTYRPRRVTSKPVVSGAQTAVVVGPKGEEIYCDKYGRVKVQFHWDREGKRDENSSCWIRCMQVSAGNRWGTVFLPRIGQEVVVEFLEGDPDRPIVTGVVYNEEQMPHYALPEHKTKSYFKTNSSKGGDGFNELCFEDKAGEERIFLHAQKDMDVRVCNDSKTRICGNGHQIIGWQKDGKKGGDQRELVWQDKHLHVKRHQVEHVEGSMQLMIGNGDAENPGKLDIVVEKQETRQIGDGGLHLSVDGDCNEKIGGGLSQTIGGDHHVKVGGGYGMEAAGGDVYIKSGMNLVIEAGTMITLKVGGNFISIGPAGVTILGTLVNINSGGAPGAASPPQPKEPAKAQKAKPAEPSHAHKSKTGRKSSK